MRRFYQESWQGIPFSSFAHISFFNLAESKFYSVFYEELFHRYKSWNDLPETWRKNKEIDAEWLASQIKELIKNNPERQDPVRVLSIGSGVGYMERELLKKMPEIELYVNEPGTVGMRWLKKLIPANRIFIGPPSSCLPSDIFWDVIYLSAVDYALSNRDFERLLETLRNQLASQGELICISASLLEEETLAGSAVNAMKNIIRFFLHYLDVRRQQFWGWRRARREYRDIFKKAGFKNINDGFIEDGFESYWIRGN